MTNNESPDNSFKEQILKDIATQNIKVYSRTHFLLRIVLLAIVAFLTLVVSIFLFNYVFFNLRISGHQSLLNFGSQGLLPFLEFFPWLALMIDIVLIGILEWLLRKFRFGYRSPVLYLLLGLFVMTISAGYFVDRATNFNDALLQQADHDFLPAPFGELYENARGSSLAERGICRCTIIAINGRVLSAHYVDEDNFHPATITILVPSTYVGVSSLKVGDIIFVAGTARPSGTIQAFDINPLPANTVHFSD